MRRAANEFKYGPAVSLIGGNNNGGNNNGNYTGGGSSTAQRQTFTANGVQFTMIRVEGNGSPYYIGETEVTQALWQAVMGSNPSFTSGNNRPVEQVSWNDCQTFISKLNSLTGKIFRLPDDDEWKYAAKGGNKTHNYKYSGSNNIGEVAWYNDNSDGRSHNVMTKAPNELGIYDMTGNVWEWTSTTAGSFRVFRGGSWFSSALFCTVTNRNSNAPTYRYNHLGLRLAL